MTTGLVLIAFVQLLYLEAMRLRARDLPALAYFKEELEERIGVDVEQGMLAFSLVKHSLLVLIGLAVLGAVLRGESPTWGAVLEGSGAAMLFMLAGAYFGPHLLYRRSSARWLAPLAPGLRFVVVVMRPVAGLFTFLETLASLGTENGEPENGNTGEHLEALIEAGADEGLIAEEDRKLIHSVVALGDKTTREVMTPRPNVVAVPEEATMEDARTLAIEHHYSRFPVYREKIDNIIGFLHVRDILRLDYAERSLRTVKDFMHPAKFVPETKPLLDLLREMQSENVHLAIVVDEYGETAGIATMEDVVEEVFGEIHDEYDARPDIVEEDPGVYVLSGTVDLDQLLDLFDFRPDEDTESTTVGGLASEWLGRVPEVGEAVERDGIRLEVTAGDERHVQQVRVSRSEPRPNSDPE